MPLMKAMHFVHHIMKSLFYFLNLSTSVLSFLYQQFQDAKFQSTYIEQLPFVKYRDQNPKYCFGERLQPALCNILLWTADPPQSHTTTCFETALSFKSSLLSSMESWHWKNTSLNPPWAYRTRFVIFWLLAHVYISDWILQYSQGSVDTSFMLLNVNS